jgi:hypothetical protein
MPQLSPEVIRILKESIPQEEEKKSLVEQILSEPTEDELLEKQEEESSIWRDFTRGTRRLFATGGMQTIAPAAIGLGTTKPREEQRVFSAREGYGFTKPAISTKQAAEMTAKSPLYNWGIDKYTKLQLQLKENPELLRPKEIADLPYWHPRVIATAVGDAVPSLIEVMVPTLAAGAVGGPAAAIPVLLTTTFGMEYGGMIDTAMEMGLTPQEATNAAVLVGTINAAIGIIPGTRALKALGLMSKTTQTRIIREIVDRGLYKNIKKEALGQGVTEMFEEIAQESVNMAGEVYGLGADIKLDEAVRRYYEVAVGAKAVGGTTGAVTGGVGFKSAEKASNTVQFAAQEITEDAANDLQVSMVEGESTVEIWPESKFKDTAYKPEQFDKIGENENGEAIYAVQVQGTNSSEGGISISQTADRSTILEEVVEYRLKNLGENQGTLIERIQNWATTLRQIAEENNIPIRFENTVNGNIELFSDAMVYHYGGYGELNPESAAITYIPPDIAEDFINQMGEMSDGTRVFDYLKGTGQEVDSPAFIRQQVDESMQQDFDGDMQERAPPGETKQMIAPTEVVKNEAFKRWFKDSKAVDSEGNPVIVYHGTLSDIQEFNLDKANPESDAGMGYYFTSNPEDASDNYGSPSGPDITQRVEQLAERDENYGQDDDVDAAIRTRIRNELADNEGAVMPVFLSMQNPATSRTYLEPMETYNEELDEYDVNEDSDAYMMYESIPYVSRDFDDIDWAAVQAKFAELAYNEPNAIELFDAFKKSDEVAYITDEDGNLASGEFVRRVFEEGGFDGLIFDKADQRFNMDMPDDVTHYIAFKPNQIKSAFNLGTFDPDTDDISFQLKYVKPVWYSKTLKEVEDKFPPSMKIDAVKNFLQKKLQIPNAEYEWLDIDYFLGVEKFFGKDKSKVTKEDLTDWIHFNSINIKDNFYKKRPVKQIGEVMTSEEIIKKYFTDKTDVLDLYGGVTIEEELQEFMNDGLYIEHRIYETHNGDLVWSYKDETSGNYAAIPLHKHEPYVYEEGVEEDEDGIYYSDDGLIGRDYEDLEAVEDAISATASKSPKWRWSGITDLTEPGRYKDYQELVLTIGDMDIRGKTEMYSGNYARFSNNHFSDINAVAHIRFNSRISEDGKRVLFLEEIQSDWDKDIKQSGAINIKQFSNEEKKLEWRDGTDKETEPYGIGIYLEGTMPAARKWVDSEIKNREEKNIHIPDLRPNQVRNGYQNYHITEELDEIPEKRFRTHLINDKGKTKGHIGFPSLKEAKNYVQTMLNAAKINKTIDGFKSYDMPYKDNVWVSLTLKRMLRYAAENNFDAMAWTTPRQQLQRNRSSIRNTVDAIHYMKNMRTRKNGFGDVVGQDIFVKINGIKGKESVVDVNVPLFGQTKIDGQITSLEGLVGKKMATKIREDVKKGKGGIIEGEDLALGEQGFIDLYETTIKKRLKDLSKKNKWNANIGTLEIDSNTLSNEMFEEYQKQRDEPNPLTWNEFAAQLPKDKKVLLNQPYIEITPEMKMSAMEGMPTFQLTKPQDVPGWVYNDAGKNAGKPKITKKPVDSWWNTNIIPLSQRLRRIDESLVSPVRMVDFKIFTQTEDNIKTVKPFLDTMKEIKNENAEDYGMIDLAMKNGDAKVLESMFKRYKSKRLNQKYLLVRAVLDDIYMRAENAGMDMGFIDEYFPRQVSDFEGLIKHFYGNFDKGILDKEIAAKEKDLKRKLTMEEKTDLLSARLRGFGKKVSNKPGATKKRTQQFVTSDMNQFYHSLEHSLTQYIATMNNSIETSLFFGGRKTKGEISDSMIGKKVAELMDEKKISPENQAELTQIIKARFNTASVSPSVQALKTLGYLGTMGNISSSITQIGDLAWAAYVAPRETAGAVGKAVIRKSKITKSDLGIDKLSYEFRDDAGISKILNFVFKATGLDFMDNLGKETLINATIAKYQRKAKAGQLEGDRRLNEAFGNDVNKVIGDLKRGVITERVKYLAFYTLADFQPISYTEVPEGYTQGNYTRLMYMLRTFTIKQFDAFRTESINLIRKGKRQNNQKLVNEGVGNMVKLASVFVLANASADALKDLIHNRKINLTDYAIDNILRLFGVSRFMAYYFRRYGPEQAILKFFTPPVLGIPAAVGKDVYDGVVARFDEEKKFNWNELETIKVIPFVGKLYYWWFGKGRDLDFQNRIEFDPNNKELAEMYKQHLKKAIDNGWMTKKDARRRFSKFKNKRKEGLKRLSK